MPSLLSHNRLTGAIPSHFSVLDLHDLQRLELQNNKLSNITFTGTAYLPPNVTVWLQGNPLCSDSKLAQFCVSQPKDKNNSQSSTNNASVCPAQACLPPYEYSPTSPVDCFCASPLFVEYRLKSPGFSNFRWYRHTFEKVLTSTLNLFHYQLYIDSFFVLIVLSNVTDGDNSPSYGFSKGALAGLVLGTIADAVTLAAVVILQIMRMHVGNYHSLSGRHHSSTCSIKIVGLKDFTYRETTVATNNFEKSTQVGEGGYGKVYKGILADGTVVAKNRAQEGSLQGVKEFLTEIEFLSRLHRQNLVSLIGYCDEEASTCSIKIVGLKDFTYRETTVATNNFEKSTQVGEGGYGKVYKGILADGTVVAKNRAQEGSLQGVKEFLTEIEFLSRLHRQNLVSLIGYCDEEASMSGSGNPQLCRPQDVFTVMGRCWVLEDEFSYPINPNLRNSAYIQNTMRQEWAWLFHEYQMSYNELVGFKFPVP
nr:isoform 2 of probable lrr receptor-like serine/threonine-protein kinase [Quercus suber]